MNELHFLIHNLSDLAPNHDRRPHCRVVDILVENWAGGQYITYNYREHIMLIGKIYKSFEALEETLGKLQLEEPLFITYMAKKSFADTVFSQIKHNNEKTQIQRFIN